jgi:hypothetical protein
VTKRKTGESKVELPDFVPEDGYPAGDGPAWISEALGATGCLDGVTRYLTDDGEETSLVLHFANGRELVIRPARLVTTRRLTETLGALGFPIKYYSPPQLALLGQAIGRVADKAIEQQQERTYTDLVSLVATWLGDCLRSELVYLLNGRDGDDVRAAISYVRAGYVGGKLAVPLILEPSRQALLAWTVPVTRLIRERLGTKSDGDISEALKRGELVRERLAARPAVGERRTHEMPVWVLYNGWQGVEVQIPADCSKNGPVGLCPL